MRVMTQQINGGGEAFELLNLHQTITVGHQVVFLLSSLKLLLSKNKHLQQQTSTCLCFPPHA